MKNLKRALSFALASVMLVGMMVVGAGAASFNDAEDIQHTEAVNSMVALGLIGGRPNGDFDPTATITRAEMAKLVCTAMNGGRDPQLDGVCQFDDVKAVNHWASGYIQYCVNMGYVNGRSATVFDPDAPITAQEAAKMMLNAIGYNSTTERFTGAGWGSRVDAVANTKGLYDDVLVLTTAKLSRDDAAQIVWNAMDATLVEYDWYPIVENGTTTIKSIAKDRATLASGIAPSILSERFKMVYKFGYMDSVSYDDVNKEYKYGFDEEAVTGVTLPKIARSVQTVALTSKTDYSDLFGMKVKILLKDNQNTTTNNTVYGMYADGNQVLFSGTVGDMDAADDDFFDDYNLEGNRTNTKVIPVIDTGATAVNLNAITGTYDKEFAAKALDVDGNGKVDYILVEPYKVGKVTFVGKETMTVQGIASYKFEDNDIAEGLERDDYVKVVESKNTAMDRAQVTKLEVVSGEVSACRKDGEVRINGTWYSKATNITACGADAGDEYDLYVIGTKYYYSEMTAEAKTLEDVVFISASQYDGKVEGAKSKAYFMDGTSKVISVTKVGTTEVKDDTSVPAIGLYTFELDGSDYELTALSDTNKVGFDGYDAKTGASSLFNALNDKLTATNSVYVVADDAIVIYAKTSTDKNGDTNVDKVSFITGKAMKSWKAASANSRGASVQLLADEVNGLDTAKVVLLQDTSSKPNSSGDAAYGYIMSKPYRFKDGSEYHLQYDLWTVDGKVTVIDKYSNLDTKKVARDDVIKYDDLGNGYIDEVTVVTSLDGTDDNLWGAKVAIMGYNNETLKVMFKGGTTENYTLDDDTQYLYVSVDDHEGVAGGAIDTADAEIVDTTETGEYWLNAWIITDGKDAGDDVKLVVYDVNNKLGSKSPDDTTAS